MRLGTLGMRLGGLGMRLGAWERDWIQAYQVLISV